MKIRRIIILLTMLLAMGTGVRAEEHISFMDVTLGQHVDSFMVGMQSRGFKPMAKKGIEVRGEKVMTGLFRGEEAHLVVRYGVHTMQVTDVTMRFPEIKKLVDFLAFFEEMKRFVTEQYCTEGEPVEEKAGMNTLPSYGMVMDYGKVMLTVDPNTAYRLSMTFTDQANTIEERHKRYD